MSTPSPFVVAVRALCEFTAKAGDLDLRFTPAPSAQEGQIGHAVVASRRRSDHYHSELGVSGHYKGLSVRGRADGYDAARNRLDEIKTHRGDLARLPDNHRALHWAQARVYAWLVCNERGLAEMEVALVYFDIATQKETQLSERHSADALREHFEQQCERFLQWAEQERNHRAQRDAALTVLAFPHAGFRAGQRELAEAVYRAASRSRSLMAQAPTGIGKTVGTIFPLLKAMPGQGLDKLFFLTAKTSGRQLALDALDRLQADHPAHPPVRVIELVARDKACEYPDKACHGDSCPLARGFYDRLPTARAAAVAHGRLGKAVLREIALQHEVCPYYLGQELARWCDAIVGDYNYYFDLSALLHGLVQANQWRVGVLVDEAHNLVERARSMYSAELDPAVFAAAKRSAPPALKSPLARLSRAWNALAKAQAEPYAVYDEVPESFNGALQRASAAIAEHFAEHPTAVLPDLLAFHFDALHFQRVLELFDANSLFDIHLTPRGKALLCLRNVVPAPHLRPRLQAAHTVTMFSATLQPQRYYADTLGLPDDSAWIDVPTPYAPEQFEVRLVGHISTRYQHREASLAPLAELMAQQYAAQPGNYLAFFSSYDYLLKALALLREHAPGVPVWEQTRRMGEAEREAFLARFTAESQGIGFAVLGGSFAEGIDLPGRRLIGAFIATLGLPQLNPVNEQIRKRLGEHFGEASAYDYAYLYPGLQKVVQAAGRVIRSPDDRGVICLIDDRYAQARVRRLLPAWWRIVRTGTQAPRISAL